MFRSTVRDCEYKTVEECRHCGIRCWNLVSNIQFGSGFSSTRGIRVSSGWRTTWLRNNNHIVVESTAIWETIHPLCLKKRTTENGFVTGFEVPYQSSDADHSWFFVRQIDSRTRRNGIPRREAVQHRYWQISFISLERNGKPLKTLLRVKTTRSFLKQKQSLLHCYKGFPLLTPSKCLFSMFFRDLIAWSTLVNNPIMNQEASRCMLAEFPCFVVSLLAYDEGKVHGSTISRESTLASHSPLIMLSQPRSA